MTVPQSSLPDLNWWINASNNSIHRIRNDDHALEIVSDASTTGWGVMENQLLVVGPV